MYEPTNKSVDVLTVNIEQAGSLPLLFILFTSSLFYYYNNIMGYS